ncbi:hypothetical protein C8R44DRAFT_871545 [Mycena epipterygia]|nr:hypothetical protein C8R44DRAFT_871545 [Mycena epipterygia]
MSWMSAERRKEPRSGLVYEEFSGLVDFLLGQEAVPHDPREERPVRVPTEERDVEAAMAIGIYLSDVLEGNKGRVFARLPTLVRACPYSHTSPASYTLHAAARTRSAVDLSPRALGRRVRGWEHALLARCARSSQALIPTVLRSQSFAPTLQFISRLSPMLQVPAGSSATATFFPSTSSARPTPLVLVIVLLCPPFPGTQAIHVPPLRLAFEGNTETQGKEKEC